MRTNRLQSLRLLLEKEKLDGLIVSQKENAYYLSGLNIIHPNKREAYLFITQDEALLYHSIFLTPPKTGKFTPIPMNSKDALKAALLTAFKDKKGFKIGIESQDLTVYELERFTSILKEASIKNTTHLLNKLRIKKDAKEIHAMQEAGAIAAKTMAWALDFVKKEAESGISEKELVSKIEEKIKKLGSSELAFPVIVAFDENSALPHHIPGEKKLTSQSVVLIDLGCKIDGYCSDMSRTIKLGEKTEEFIKVETTVKSAYEAALDVLRSPHPSSNKIDQAAREVIAKNGFSENFIHSTGHGLGLEIHEPPSLYHTSHSPIGINSTFTIEPGVYFKNKFGYRHENTILFSEDQTATNLTQAKSSPNRL